MKILVVSGFLGAGKTTFIREMIRQCAIKPVVLENEYGQAAGDAQALSADTADVWGLSEGCICCTKSEDMTNSVLAIENVIGPEFLVIEPSGIAKLGSVLASLRRIEYERITLLRPVVVLDAQSFFRDIKAFSEICEDQVRSAGTLVLSKTAALTNEEAQAIEKTVRALNPDAELLCSAYEKQGRDWWKSLLTNAFSGRLAEADSTPPPGLETLTLKACGVISPAQLICILNDALRGKFGEIVRAKGTVFAQNQWVQFDISGGIARLAGCDGPASAECVWIGFGMARSLLDEAFHDHDGGAKRWKASSIVRESPEKSRISAFKSLS